MSCERSEINGLDEMDVKKSVVHIYFLITVQCVTSSNFK